MEPTERERLLLHRARGGRSTTFGTAEHEAFEAMAEQGWVKEATLTDEGVAWRLSGDGLKYA